MNLASVGATSEEVEQEQLERALELKPDVVTLVCGANDVLVQHAGPTQRPTPPASRACSRGCGESCRSVHIVTATYPDISRFLELRPRTQARVVEGMERFNAASAGWRRAMTWC